MLRIVVDTNVLVSGIISPRGTPARILDAWRDGQFELLISDAILAEVRRVLQYPKIAKRHLWSSDEIEEFLRELAELSIKTAGKLKLDIIKNDLDDNAYLECAVEGGADVIVSGDSDVLNIAEYEGVVVISPKSFLEILH